MMSKVVSKIVVILLFCCFLMLHYELYSDIINIYLNINDIRIYFIIKYECYVNMISMSLYLIFVLYVMLFWNLLIV